MNKGKNGLGYTPPTVKGQKVLRMTRKISISYYPTLNGYFVKEGEDFPFCGNTEPWFDMQPRFEVFFQDEFDWVTHEVEQ